MLKSEVLPADKAHVIVKIDHAALQHGIIIRRCK